ncbi:MAG: hypothetical protein GKS00_17890 [Alphaproteobacteria bacterium]|nr:hypothetical protein [Alphaproteobacteria bacterium]
MTETTFTETEARALTILADMIVPASDEYGVPGAGDPAIMDNILADAERHRARIIAALSALDDIARKEHGAVFTDLDPAQRDSVAETFRAAHAAGADLIANLTVQGYYRDDRVMTSLGMEPRPPHPKGYEVEQGDWSLLDPVRQREAFYRETE